MLQMCAERRSNRRVISTWRKPLQEVLNGPQLLSDVPTCGATGEPFGQASPNQHETARYVLDARVQALHILAAEGSDPVVESTASTGASGNLAASCHKPTTGMASAVKSFFRHKSSATASSFPQEASLA